MDDDRAIAYFKELLQFETISSLGPDNGSYDACANWLLNLCEVANIPASILPESKPHKPIVIAEWVGSDPSLPCIFLNSHYDVVPVITSSWTANPFAAEEKDGRIYGRGAQDMKCVCVQYVVALQRMRLKLGGNVPRRTVRLAWVPDEEVGGADGMGILLGSTWFKEVAVGVALDEGLASESSRYSVFYGERLPWWIKVTATGNTGHASRFIDGTAVEQIMGVATKALEFRLQQKQLLHSSDDVATAAHDDHNCSHSVAAKKRLTLGDVTTLNITRLHTGGGEAEAYNVVPAVCEMAMDIRISPRVAPEEMRAVLQHWCEEAEAAATGLPASGGVSWKYHINQGQQHAVTSTNSTENPWWELFTTCLRDQCSAECDDMIFPAATDSRFLRVLGIKAIGFSPMRNSPILLHEHDEFLHRDVFLEGCSVYEKLLEVLCSQERMSCD